MEHIRQSRPDHFLGLHVKAMKVFEVVASLLESGQLKLLKAGARTSPSPETRLALLSSFNELEGFLVLGLFGFRYFPGANLAWYSSLFSSCLVQQSLFFLFITLKPRVE